MRTVIHAVRMKAQPGDVCRALTSQEKGTGRGGGFRYPLFDGFNPHLVCSAVCGANRKHRGATMLVVVALVAAAISQGAGPKAPWNDRAPLAFATFREFREFVASADSEVSVPGFIDNAPVVVSAKGWTRSREALRAACAALAGC